MSEANLKLITALREMPYAEIQKCQVTQFNGRFWKPSRLLEVNFSENNIELVFMVKDTPARIKVGNTWFEFQSPETVMEVGDGGFDRKHVLEILFRQVISDLLELRVQVKNKNDEWVPSKIMGVHFSDHAMVFEVKDAQSSVRLNFCNVWFEFDTILVIFSEKSNYKIYEHR